MNDHPIHLGSMLFTMVDPNPGHEVAYNRWYERDHFYAGCLIGPWLFAGSRWVAPRSLKDLRFPDDSPVAVPVDAGSYLAIYWILDGHYEEHFDWALAQVQDLYANNRGFHERTHRHTALYEQPWSIYRDADPVPIELALDHHYKGLGVVVLERTDGTSADDLNSYLKDDAVPSLLEGSAIASTVNWTPIDRSQASGGSPMDLGSPTGGAERVLQMFFLEEKPEGSWDRFRAYADAVEGSGKAKVLFAAPFYRTVVGTDTYTDQLW